MRFTKQSFFILFCILLGSAGFKLWLILSGWVPFNSDEAIVGLMARHILQGERPIFFYGQAYMGSLDAFLVAGGFGLLGETVEVIRLVQMILYMAFLVTTALLGRFAFNSWRVGLIAAALLAIPTVNMTLYTTASLGGYGEALLLGNVILLVGFWLLREMDVEESSRSDRVLIWGWGLWGILVGFGLWVNGLTLVYGFPMGIALLWKWLFYARLRRSKPWFFALLAGGLGLFMGSLPWWIYAYQTGSQALVRELLGSAVAVEKSSWIVRSANHLMSLVLLGGTATFGLRPPWEVRWLGLPLTPLILAFWLAVIVFFVKMAIQPSSYRLPVRILGGVCLTLMAGFVFTSFGVDPSGRYFLPLAVPLTMMAALFIDQLKIPTFARVLVVAGVIVFQIWGNVQAATKFPPGITTQFDMSTAVDHRYDKELIHFLEQQGEKSGYTNYWVSYPLAFLSGENIIFVPRLPYHQDLRYTPRDDRYAPYTEMVRQSNHTAYIITPHENLQSYLQSAFRERGIKWEEKVIGDYRVFYRLSQPIRPEDIGLGSLREAP